MGRDNTHEQDPRYTECRKGSSKSITIETQIRQQKTLSENENGLNNQTYWRLLVLDLSGGFVGILEIGIWDFVSEC
jgi:hypothetical protein